MKLLVTVYIILPQAWIRCRCMRKARPCRKVFQHVLNSTVTRWPTDRNLWNVFLAPYANSQFESMSCRDYGIFAYNLWSGHKHYIITCLRHGQHLTYGPASNLLKFMIKLLREKVLWWRVVGRLVNIQLPNTTWKQINQLNSLGLLDISSFFSDTHIPL